MVNTVQMGRSPMFNFIKGLACMSVIFIHITFPGNFGNIIKGASEYAVPIFLMIAGFYSVGCTERKIYARLKKMIRILVYGYLCFFCIPFLQHVIAGGMGEWLLQIFSIKTLIKGIVFCTVDFATPLWYLIAMAETYIFWFGIVKHKKEQVAVRYIPILIVFNLIVTIICETNNYAWFWKINFITRALPWFMVGYWVSTHKHVVVNVKNYIYYGLIGMGLGIIVASAIFLTTIDFSEIGVLIYSFSLFILCVKNLTFSVSKPIQYVGDRLSLNIYIYHVIVSYGINIVMENIFCIDTANNIYLWFRPLIVLVVTVVFSWVIDDLQNSLARRN